MNKLGIPETVEEVLQDERMQRLRGTVPDAKLRQVAERILAGDDEEEIFESLGLPGDYNKR